ELVISSLRGRGRFARASQKAQRPSSAIRTDQQLAICFSAGEAILRGPLLKSAKAAFRDTERPRNSRSVFREDEGVLRPRSATPNGPGTRDQLFREDEGVLREPSKSAKAAFRDPNGPGTRDQLFREDEGVLREPLKMTGADRRKVLRTCSKIG